MRAFRIPALVLAAVLQLAPILRVTCVTQAAPPCSFAIVLKFLVGAAALLGTYHAVSAASAAIAGVSNTNPIGPVTTNALGKVGQPFSYRIIVTNPGKDHAQDLWNAAPLPPGLTINTNLGGNGFITGTPTAAGVYPVTLTAGNANSDIVVHMDITITIQGTTSSPPTITGPPMNQIATAGATVSLSVQATGDTLTYQWLFNSNPLPGATASTLTLSNVATNQSGLYSVIVSNSVKAVPSPSAQLLVVTPPAPDAAPNLQIQPGTQGEVSLSFKTAPGYRYVLLSSDALTLSSWIEVTNIPPAFVGSSMSLMQGASPACRFYRVEVSGN